MIKQKIQSNLRELGKIYLVMVIYVMMMAVHYLKKTIRIIKVIKINITQIQMKIQTKIQIKDQMNKVMNHTKRIIIKQIHLETRINKMRIQIVKGKVKIALNNQATMNPLKVIINKKHN
ncbi:hypothetical protein DD607_34850 [Salmonella sp. 3DZ2-4SM]|nr:hypothetical protein DD607_34850 [Salmonella sp. 3DZ2-4SM]